MSNISPDFIHSVESLYEEINVQQQDFLNEDSEYYDAEAAELVEDILSSVSLSMVYEGYSANAVIGFLADSSEEDILEKYLSFDDNVISESTVDENYIQEQLQILDYMITEGWRDKLVTSVGKFFAKRAPALKSAGPLTQQAATRLAMKGKPTLATKVRVGVERAIGPKGRKAVQAIKDFGSKAKSALTGPTAQKIAKGAGIFGLGAAGGFVGAKMAGAGSKTTDTPKPSPTDKAKWNASAGLGGQAAFKAGGGAAKMRENPKMTAADVQKQGMINIKNKKPATPPAAPSNTAAPASQKPAPAPAKDKTWTFNNKQVTDAEVNKKYNELRKSDPKAAENYGRNVWSQKYGQPTQGPKDAQVDSQSVENSVKAQQELDKKRAEDKLKADQKKQEEQNKRANTALPVKESHEPYDIILEYLMDGGHADTIEEAHYIMLEMDTDAVGAIMQEYNDYVLAEEISEWVDDLIDEGYDFSEYSWDDIVEYYVTEAKYGTAKGRKALAKKVRAGKDVGRKGAGFEEIVQKASGKYGKERATKIAAAAMWKNLGGKKGKTQKEW